VFNLDLKLYILSSENLVAAPHKKKSSYNVAGWERRSSRPRSVLFFIFSCDANVAICESFFFQIWALTKMGGLVAAQPNGR
jgi:hypothetical protein